MNQLARHTSKCKNTIILRVEKCIGFRHFDTFVLHHPTKTKTTCSSHVESNTIIWATLNILLNIDLTLKK